MKMILYSPSLFNDPSTGDLMKPSIVLCELLKPEALKQYVGMMDMMASKHIDMYWTSNINKEVNVYLLSKKHTFALSCRLFLNIEDPECVAKITDGFDRIMAGFFSLPIGVPGTKFNHAIKARINLHKEIREIIRKRKKELKEKRDSKLVHDILSQMILMSDKNSKVTSEVEIITHINGIILGSHETVTTTITFVLKYLAEFPDVCDGVFKGNPP